MLQLQNCPNECTLTTHIATILPKQRQKIPLLTSAAVWVRRQNIAWSEGEWTWESIPSHSMSAKSEFVLLMSVTPACVSMKVKWNEKASASVRVSKQTDRFNKPSRWGKIVVRREREEPRKCAKFSIAQVWLCKWQRRQGVPGSRQKAMREA